MQPLATLWYKETIPIHFFKCRNYYFISRKGLKTKPNLATCQAMFYSKTTPTILLWNWPYKSSLILRAAALDFLPQLFRQNYSFVEYFDDRPKEQVKNDRWSLFLKRLFCFYSWDVTQDDNVKTFNAAAAVLRYKHKIRKWWFLF